MQILCRPVQIKKDSRGLHAMVLSQYKPTGFKPGVDKHFGKYRRKENPLQDLPVQKYLRYLFESFVTL